MPTNCWSVLDHFVGLALKGSTFACIMLKSWSNILVKHDETKHSHFVFKHNQDMHVVKLNWQTIVFLFIYLFLFMQTFLLLIHIWLEGLAITHKSIITRFFYKQHIYKQRQVEIDKKSSK